MLAARWTDFEVISDLAGWPRVIGARALCRPLTRNAVKPAAIRRFLRVMAAPASIYQPYPCQGFTAARFSRFGERPLVR